MNYSWRQQHEAIYFHTVLYRDVHCWTDSVHSIISMTSENYSSGSKCQHTQHQILISKCQFSKPKPKPRQASFQCGHSQQAAPQSFWLGLSIAFSHFLYPTFGYWIKVNLLSLHSGPLHPFCRVAACPPPLQTAWLSLLHLPSLGSCQGIWLTCSVVPLLNYYQA